MIEFNNILTLTLVINSFALILFIFNQNDSTKDSLNTQNFSSLTNPLENITWILVFIEFILLLIKIKNF